MNSITNLIPFNIPLITGNEIAYYQQVIERGRFCGDGNFTIACNQWLERYTGTKKALLTTSCTHALEMAAMLIDIKPDDEVIMPSFTFVSTANPFVIRGAKIVFVDVDPYTMNIDSMQIEQAVTHRTRAIIPVHYAGVSCDMDSIMSIAEKYNLYVIEDAAQGINAMYKKKHLGTIGHLGAISFHETKNIQCGEGGVLFINDINLIKRAEIIREKGTNRMQFLRNEIDKYSWVDIGSSYLPSELCASFLLAQLQESENVKNRRLFLWKKYYMALKPLAEEGKIEMPFVPVDCQHNGHIFYIKLKNAEDRQALINYLKENKIHSVFHYVPLHSSKAGMIYGRMFSRDKYTTIESERLLRLPMFHTLSEDNIDYITRQIQGFFLL